MFTLKILKLQRIFNPETVWMICRLCKKCCLEFKKNVFTISRKVWLTYRQTARQSDSYRSSTPKKRTQNTFLKSYLCYPRPHAVYYLLYFLLSKSSSARSLRLSTSGILEEDTAACTQGYSQRTCSPLILEMFSVLDILPNTNLDRFKKKLLYMNTRYLMKWAIQSFELAGLIIQALFTNFQHFSFIIKEGLCSSLPRFSALVENRGHHEGRTE